MSEVRLLVLNGEPRSFAFSSSDGGFKTFDNRTTWTCWDDFIHCYLNSGARSALLWRFREAASPHFNWILSATRGASQ